jgi:multidrug efflux pump
MLGVTLFGLFLTPVFYVLLRSIGGSKKLHSAHKHEAPLTAGSHVAPADSHDGR